MTNKPKNSAKLKALKDERNTFTTQVPAMEAELERFDQVCNAGKRDGGSHAGTVFPNENPHAVEQYNKRARQAGRPGGPGWWKSTARC